MGPSYTTQTLQAAGLTPCYSHFTLLRLQITDYSYVGEGVKEGEKEGYYLYIIYIIYIIVNIFTYIFYVFQVPAPDDGFINKL